MVNTTWSTTDKSNITLTGSNLIATASGTNAWVRAIDQQITGKFYWEVTATTFTNASSGAGIASITASLANAFSSPGLSIGTAGVNRSGILFTDGNSTGLSFGIITNGTVICIAFDATARLIWVRLGAAGNWNTSASANPVTGTGGVSCTLGDGIPAYPVATCFVTSDKVTANFGDTAFTGTVPSGFTSGFPAGTTSSTNAILTQTGVEEWFTTNPPAQVTQVAIEEWGVLPTPELRATQIGSSAWVTNTHAPMNVTQIGASVWINTTASSLPVTGIASTAALGTPSFTVAGFVTVSATGIASAEAVGSPSLLMGVQLLASGIASTEAVGSPTVSVAAISGGLILFRGFP